MILDLKEQPALREQQVRKVLPVPKVLRVLKETLVALHSNMSLIPIRHIRTQVLENLNSATLI